MLRPSLGKGSGSGRIRTCDPGVMGPQLGMRFLVLARLLWNVDVGNECEILGEPRERIDERDRLGIRVRVSDRVPEHSHLVHPMPLRSRNVVTTAESGHEPVRIVRHGPPWPGVRILCPK